MVFLENVAGLLSHDEGRTFGTILDTLRELGYVGQYQVLNSKNFGVPQNRERVFIVGHLGERGIPKIFPIGEDGQKANDKRCFKEGVEQTAQTLRARDYANWNGNFVMPDIAGCLTGGGHSGGLDGKEPYGKGYGICGEVSTDGTEYEQSSLNSDIKILQDGSNGQLHQGINVVGTLESNGWEKRHEQVRRVHGIDGIAPTIPTGTGGGVMTKIELNTKIRRLTPVECERLQGYPDSWTKYGMINGKVTEMSDTQRYKMCGNSVTVNVIEAIARKIIQTHNNVITEVKE